MFYRIFIIFLLFFSCSSKKEASVEENTKKKESKGFSCPNEGHCFLEVLNETSLEIKTINNALLLSLSDDKEKTTIHFQYSKNLEEMAVDGGYREEYFFEIDNRNHRADLKNEALQQVKMLYGKYTNSRGNNNGLHFLKNGHLNYEINEGKINFSFTTNLLDPLIKEIHVTENEL
ncbi:hypothetical protein [Flavobacterium sp. J27]|uniref:hypothetical protein n=1 Tax=Flavobacterium sp. J27 TaxID=2060419 RepID=UPI00102F4C83|nr:hypothetical protein [Flavobacterium sp. J27]